VVYRKNRPAPTLSGVLRKAGRGISPVTLVLAGLCFLLPFVTVGCDTPGGYARAAPGGSTTYTGVDLAFGGQPDVTPDHVRALPAGEDDQLPVQPAAAVVLVLVVAAIGFAVRVSAPRARRSAVAVLAGVGATALLVNQALVEATVTVRVGDHLTRFVQSGGAVPAGKAARDYVQTGQGFGLCLLLLLLVAAANAVGWWLARPRTALVGRPDDQPTQQTTP
jgi:hypothetical protein